MSGLSGLIVAELLAVVDRWRAELGSLGLRMGGEAIT